MTYVTHNVIDLYGLYSNTLLYELTKIKPLSTKLKIFLIIITVLENV